MKLVGLMVVRNEDWILRLSTAVALMWCDELVVLDHGSTDETPAILRLLAETFDGGGKIHLLRVEEQDWNEMSHRHATLDKARAVGATHCALVDADELLTLNLVAGIREQIRSLEASECLDLPMIPVWRSMQTMRTDPCVWTRAVVSLAFRLTPDLCWKRAEDGYEHHHRMPYGIKRPRKLAVTGGVMHCQWAQWERVVAKHALYKLREAQRWPGRMSVEKLNEVYGQALDERGLELSAVPDEWTPFHGCELYRSINLTDGSVHVHMSNPDDLLGQGEPWQRAAARKLAAELGPERIRGLDLFGVVGGGA